MAVLPQSHFVVIFTITETALLPSISLPQIELPPGFLSLLSSDSTGLNTPVLSRSPSRLSSASGSPFRSSRRESRSPSPYPQQPSPPSKNDGILIMGICRSQISGFEGLQPKAKCLKGHRGTPLASLARCFMAVERILLHLGLDPGNLEASQLFPLEDGNTIKLDGEAILNFFDWNPKTFTSKRKKYRLAKSIALRTWKDNTDADAEFHKLYRGIRFLWAENGPLASLDAPLPCSEAQDDEKCAADIKQAHLDNCKSLYDKYTC
ncbi:hypothetical protein K438DRAFT_1849832 [Mycena galopus ATCC 62051]|nr:hypothetical protein K438DRAFT_1849832 [Mycena galopus ATCC 62051]